MKHIGKLAVLGAVLAASAPFASATTVTLGSWATGAPNPGVTNTAFVLTGFLAQTFTPSGTPPVYPTPPTTPAPTGLTANTFTLSPGTPLVWAAALANSTWVGAAATAGPLDPITNPSPVNPAQGFYAFTTTFNLGTGSYSGNLNVLADDTTEVFLGNTLLVPFGVLGSDAHCADNAPTCIVPPTPYSLALSGLTGAQTLTFVVVQEGNIAASDPSGIDFDASLSTPAITPEPNSLILLGTGLLGAAGMLVRKRQTV
jgi:PEP-CTERM motif